MKPLRIHYKGKPVIYAHYHGRRLMLDEIYPFVNSGLLLGDAALPVYGAAWLADVDSAEEYGNAADTFISDAAVFPDAKSGLSFGSAAEGEASSDIIPTVNSDLGIENIAPTINGASKLPTPNGALGLEHEAPTIHGTAHLPEINGSIITGHEALAINGASKLETVNSGAATGHDAETLTADCVFHEADDGTGAGENAETFKTTVPVWDEGNDGAGFGEDAEGVIFDSAYAGANSGEAFGNESEAEVKPPEYSTAYLTFSSASPFTVAWASGANKTWDGALYWSVDKQTWIEFGISSVLSSNSDNELYMCGKGNTHISAPAKIGLIKITGTGVSVGGNIMSLLDHESVEQGIMPTMGSYAFTGLFGYNRALVSGPTLTAPVMTSCCYQRLYYNCPNLVNASYMAATSIDSLGSSCCSEMYYGCTSLETLSPLYPTVLPANCYYRMYYGCTKIKISGTQTSYYDKEYSIPFAGVATSYGYQCTEDMFTGTGGSFTGTPSVKQPSLDARYYTANSIVQPGQVIQAGRYYGRNDITSLESVSFLINFEETTGGDTLSDYYGIDCSGVSTTYFNGLSRSLGYVELGVCEKIGSNPDVWKMNITTDNNCFTVLEDTEVEEEIYRKFNKYFTNTLPN